MGIGTIAMRAVTAPGLGRASLMLALCALPLGGLIVGLAADQFIRQRAALLGELTGAVAEQHHALAAMLGDADRQVGRMRLTMEDALAAGAPAGRAALVPAAARLSHAVLEGLERPPSPAGNLIGVPDLAARPEVEAALEMLAVVEVEARLGSRTHWSYFFSARGDFITIHPYVSLAEIAGSASRPVGSVAELVAYWLDYDVFRLGTPAANPAGASYWTPVYQDAGGAGPMVSHAAPVYAGGAFLGIVGIDVLLETFQGLLSRLHQPVGFLAVVDAGGTVLAAEGASFGGDGAAMRRHLAQTGLAGLGDQPAFRRHGADWALSRALAGTPFRLLYIVPNAEMNGWLLPRLAVFGWILLGLVLTLAGLWLFLHRQYIRPAFGLGDYLVAQAAGGAAEPPRLPALWQGSLERISDAFASGRIYRQRLEESEARFLAATSGLPDGFAILGPEGLIVFYNAAFQRLLGAGGQSGLTVGCPVADAVGLAGLGEEPRLLHGRWITCRRTPMAGGGQVIVLRDVTLARAAEMQLRESEARYRTVVNTQTEFVARFTPEGRPTFANDAYCRYMNLTQEELVGRGVSDFSYILPEDRAAHDAHLAELSPEKPTCTVVFRSILPDGSFHWEEWNDTGIFDAEGRLVELQAVGRDITERKLAEEALRQSEKMAALGSLLAGVAHELNNPLSIVVGYAGMLQELAPDEPTRRRAQEIHSAAERCARIVRTFLAMARSRPSERVAVQPGEVIADALRLAAYGLRSNGVEVAVEAAPDLPAVLADRDQLHQVFMNLILNAQQAMMAVEGPRRLTIRSFGDGGRVVTTLTDTGHGIDPAARPRLFDPFFTTKPQGMGTGIGLSVCLKIVEAHGGTIRLDPAPGGGAEARVELPATHADKAEAGEETIPALSGHVLVVDDEPGIVSWLAEALAAAGLTVTGLTSGQAAQEALAAGDFDALLTDLRMPGVGGDRLVVFVAEHRPELLARTVVMTGDALGSETALAHPVAAVIEKPVDRAALLAVLAEVLG